MRFVNAKLVFPHRIEQGVLRVDKGVFAEDNGIGEIVDCHGKYIIPGLIDIHVHGGGGADTMDATPDSLEVMANTLLAHGTVAFLATTMSATVEAVEQAALNVQACQGRISGAEILGAHMEGPVINRKFKGAQAEEVIVPDEPGLGAQFIRRIAKLVPGLFKIATIAPDRVDTEETIRACVENGIIPSAGHTGANYDQMKQAIEWGVRSMTHSFNAMPGIVHRNPGPVTAALNDSRVNMEFIADGVHVHPAVLDMALRSKGCLACAVSDSIRAMGMPDGEYELGGQLTVVKDGMALLPDGTIAGSAFPLLQAIRTLVKYGWSIHDAIVPATLNPALMLGVAERLGSLDIGKDASFIILNEDLSVDSVWQHGAKI